VPGWRFYVLKSCMNAKSETLATFFEIFAKGRVNRNEVNHTIDSLEESKSLQKNLLSQHKGHHLLFSDLESKCV